MNDITLSFGEKVIGTAVSLQNVRVDTREEQPVTLPKKAVVTAGVSWADPEFLKSLLPNYDITLTQMPKRYMHHKKKRIRKKWVKRYGQTTTYKGCTLTGYKG